MIRAIVGKKGLLYFILLFCYSGIYAQFLDIISHNSTSFHAYDSQSKIVQGNDGDVFIGWRSKRQDAPATNIYIQKLDKFGRPQWEADGNPVYLSEYNQGKFDMLPDGFGGVVIVWEDFRRGSDKTMIVAQRINGKGQPIWDLSGEPVSTMLCRQRNPQLISDQKNAFYVVWEDNRNGYQEQDLFAQHFNLGAKMNWKGAGKAICQAKGLQQSFHASTDGKHGLVVVWEDFRNGKYWNLFCQRIDEFGQSRWHSDGLDIFAGRIENQKAPKVIPDGYGGLVFVYQQYSEKTRGFDIARARIDVNGDLIYHYSLCHTYGDQIKPVIAKKGGVAVVAWEDTRNEQRDIYGQMFSIRDGLTKWETNGVSIAASVDDEFNPMILTSVTGNYQLFGWQREMNGKMKLGVKRLAEDGSPVWNTYGVKLCEADGQQTEMSLWLAESGGLWASWTDTRMPPYTKIYVQRVHENSAVLLEKEGFLLAGAHHDEHAKIDGLSVLEAQNGDYFLAWQDFRNGEDNPDLYIQRMTVSGEQLWKDGGVMVCGARGEQARPFLINDGSGGVIIAWVDSRNGRDENLYAQRISGKGRLLWEAEGVAVCEAPKGQTHIRAISDGKEGVIIAWSDARDFLQTGFDLYIQRIDHAGVVMWGKNGKPFARFAGLQSSPSLVEDGNGGAYICWMDMRDGPANIYLQHINAYGIYVWEYGGRVAVKEAYNQRNPSMTLNDRGDICLVWEDARYGDGKEKIVMQCITPEGGRYWGSIGMQVCNMAGKQANPKVLTDANGFLYVSWLDHRAKEFGGIKLISQKFDSKGIAQWQLEGVTIAENLGEYNDFRQEISPKEEVYFSWSANASGKSLAYYQKLDSKGVKQLNLDGYLLGTQNGEHFSPDVCINKDDVLLLTWIEKDTDGKYSVKGRIKRSK